MVQAENNKLRTMKMCAMQMLYTNNDADREDEKSRRLSIGIWSVGRRATHPPSALPHFPHSLKRTTQLAPAPPPKMKRRIETYILTAPMYMASSSKITRQTCRFCFSIWNLLERRYRYRDDGREGVESYMGEAMRPFPVGEAAGEEYMTLFIDGEHGGRVEVGESDTPESDREDMGEEYKEVASEK